MVAAEQLLRYLVLPIVVHLLVESTHYRFFRRTHDNLRRTRVTRPFRSYFEHSTAGKGTEWC
nr:hypothetical protein JVH1_5268 [Rhodococcus sp. JVH1]